MRRPPLRHRISLYLVCAACHLRMVGSSPLGLTADALSRLADRVWP